MSATRLSSDEQVKAPGSPDAGWDDLAGSLVLPDDPQDPARAAHAPQRRALTWQQTVGFAVAHLAFVAIGRASVIEGASLSLFWPAAGVAVLWLLAESPRRQVPVLAMIAGEVAWVAWVTDAPSLLTALGCVSVVTQTWLAVFLVRRWCPELLGAGGHTSVHAPTVLVRSILAVALACTVGAGIGALSMWAAGLDSGVVASALWWGRQVSGTLVVGTVGHLGWEWLGSRTLTRPEGGSRRELALLAAVSVPAVLAILAQPLPMVFLLVPLSVWSASRFPTFVAAVHATLIGVIALPAVTSRCGTPVRRAPTT